MFKDYPRLERAVLNICMDDREPDWLGTFSETADFDADDLQHINIIDKKCLDIPKSYNLPWCNPKSENIPRFWTPYIPPVILAMERRKSTDDLSPIIREIVKSYAEHVNWRNQIWTLATVYVELEVGLLPSLMPINIRSWPSTCGVLRSAEDVPLHLKQYYVSQLKIVKAACLAQVENTCKVLKLSNFVPEETEIEEIWTEGEADNV